MYVVVDLKGHQYIVKSGDVITVDKIGQDEGSMVEIDKVVAIFDESGSQVALGNPYVKDAKVSAKLVENKKGDKIHVLKFKRKTRYERHYGFRPHQSVLQIENINI